MTATAPSPVPSPDELIDHPLRPDAKRFFSLRQRYLLAEREKDNHDRAMSQKYGRSDVPRAWMTNIENKTSERLSARLHKIEDLFLGLLLAISPRSWSSGAPLHWIMTDLTYDDAITRGPLSVIPPCAFASSAADLKRFA